MSIRYACRDCDVVCEERFDAETHAAETGHGFREVEYKPLYAQLQPSDREAV